MAVFRYPLEVGAHAAAGAKPRLIIKLCDAPGIPADGKAFLLCDQFGHVFSAQQSLKIEQGIDDITRVTVVFAVDGDEVVLA